MGDQGKLPDELAPVLRRYLEIQRQEQELKEEKAALQERLGLHMSECRLAQWYPDLDGLKLKVRCQEKTVVEYNESLLQDRLGDRFSSILAPDLGKIRRHLDRLGDTLQPVLNLVGSPAPEKVRAAIESGTVTKEEFAGAFKKTVRRVVGVSKLPPANARTQGG